MNQDLDKELEKLKSMGIDFGFDANTTDEEKEAAINSLAEMLGNVAEQEGIGLQHAFHTEEACSLDVLCELVKDIDPQPEHVIHSLTTWANQPQENVANEDLFCK